MTPAAVVCLAGLATAVAGAFLPLWQVNNSFDKGFRELPVTWWGVVDPNPAHPLLITSVLVVAVPAAVAVAVAALTLMSERRRRWFGPMVGVAATIWLLQLIAWNLVYNDHASTVDPHIGFFTIGFGLAVCIVAAMVDASPREAWGLGQSSTSDRGHEHPPTSVR